MLLKKQLVDEATWNEGQKIDIEASMEIEGEIVEDKRAPTGYEIKVKNIKMIGESAGYPIQKDQSTELLADNETFMVKKQIHDCNIENKKHCIWCN